MNLKEQLAKLYDRVKELQLIGIERDYTDAEVAETKQLLKQQHELRERIEKNADIDEKLKSAMDSDDGGDEEDSESTLRGGKAVKTGFLPQGDKFKSLAGNIAKQVQRTAGRKAIADSDTLTPIILSSQSPVEIGKPATSLLAVVPVVQRSAPRFEWLQQTVRTNNAAIVAPGAVKPTSIYGIEKRDGELRVVAHFSEPIDKYLIADNSTLATFVANELLYGLYAELERQMIEGAGGVAELKGLSATSGVLAQAFATDLVTTTRKAITRLENAGQTPSYFALSPDDWEAVELSRTADGHLELGNTAVNLAAKQLWGKPVVTVPGLDNGSGYLVGEGATELSTDTLGVETKWFEQHADDALRNLMRARCEGRFEFTVPKPSAVVALDLAA
ncbi:phage major capsid protein [Rhodococcus cerastii]|uniref:Phage major capsid protein n=1 Tax=Rhodococcus cerastii TaxID=908616 RepID=A0ABU4D550_9NOCA|nr:phage major capsid protein [Rhodococcus cerastii]MDV6304859.1 phage major capsid protein [Rhodococcus cerastii]